MSASFVKARDWASFNADLLSNNRKTKTLMDQRVGKFVRERSPEVWQGLVSAWLNHSGYTEKDLWRATLLGLWDAVEVALDEIEAAEASDGPEQRRLDLALPPPGGT